MLKGVNKMKPGLSFLSISAIAAALILFSCRASTQPNSQEQQAPRAYLGFDLNIFPGNAALPVLRKTFAFTSYWLSPPPLEKTNSWVGKRELLRSQGFGFLASLPWRSEPRTQEAMQQRYRRELSTRAMQLPPQRAKAFPRKRSFFLILKKAAA